ncbi:hypothetical protein U9M48_001790 [Paspalum notatum var. saurae]|uniref:PGG domain-containing protein n=1 Tax=Paspalum notatum var. saurae TaxID=547442 RepID=A0AAQ3PMM3_PASNO
MLGQTPATPPVPRSSSGKDDDRENDKVMLDMRKYLLLLAILAATVTYVAGLNPPGGVWLDTQDGHLTGNQILVVTYHARYNAFSYSNATAFMASGVVILLLLLGFKKDVKQEQSVAVNKDVEQSVPVNKDVERSKAVDKDKDVEDSGTTLFVVLRWVMALDLLALVVAYAAGASRDTLTTVLASVLVSPIFAYIVLHMVRHSYLSDSLFPEDQNKAVSSADESCGCTCTSTAPVSNGSKEDKKPLSKKEKQDNKRRRKILMLLAIFATTITYTAGLNPPGGFWPSADTEDGGTPVLQNHHRRRFVAFFVFNTASFVASLTVVTLLLTGRFSRKFMLHPVLALLTKVNKKFQKFLNRCNDPAAEDAPYAFTMVSLLGLVGAYAFGSCWETDSTISVIVLYLVGLVFVLLIVYNAIENKKTPAPPHRNSQDTIASTVTRRTVIKKDEDNGLRSARSLVLLLATLAATVTYQAGLNPPGGFWPDDRDGHKGGDPILMTKHATRYRVFYYCNSTALAASLVVIFMVQMNCLSRGLTSCHVLQAVMILNLIGLIGAFAAGCCRDVSTSIYVVALAGAVLVYVVFHLVFFTLRLKLEDLRKEDIDDVEKRRKLLLLLAILAVTLTYQAGLTPPGGFWSVDDGGELGHHADAGAPVLLSNYPRRYTAFFYLNATGFMASIALTILLVNPNLYRAGIHCRALYVCMVAGLFGLMGAYAAGSSRHVRTSIFMIALIAIVFIFVILLLVVFKIKPKSNEQSIGNNGAGNANEDALERGNGGTDNQEKAPPSQSTDSNDIQQHTKRMYLMLLGILAASVTYQAGLAPPGGVWLDNNDGHTVGNPVLHDSDHLRYRIFFVCNSASFTASMVVITLVLLTMMLKETKTDKKFLILAAQCMMVVDLIGLMGAYAAGSSREWETSGYILGLVAAVVFYIGVHLLTVINSSNTGQDREDH